MCLSSVIQCSAFGGDKINPDSFASASKPAHISLKNNRVWTIIFIWLCLDVWVRLNSFDWILGLGLIGFLALHGWGDLGGALWSHQGSWNGLGWKGS